MTDGGRGRAFFSRFENYSYFLAWRPMQVPPIGISRSSSLRARYVLRSEIVHIWLPSVLLVLLVSLVGRIRAHPAASAVHR